MGTARAWWAFITPLYELSVPAHNLLAPVYAPLVPAVALWRIEPSFGIGWVWLPVSAWPAVLGHGCAGPDRPEELSDDDRRFIDYLVDDTLRELGVLP